MAKSTKNEIQLADEIIMNKIYYIRGMKVMLDKDLAEMYNVETKRLKESVKRNIERFPEDFMFELTKEEFENLKSQIATSSWGGQRYLPYVFTEHGVLMLSSVLYSPVAIQANIRIMRVYTKIKEMFSTNKDVLLKLEQIEKQVGSNTENIRTIFQALKQLLNPPQKERNPIGYKLPASPSQKAKKPIKPKK
ncbi:MAG: ORF6N domain-containing protein [Chitinophagales bacterium]|jgi:hypothetical protein|nr:ORF6N domain-containing protein [Sphingobacteriales bacterium]